MFYRGWIVTMLVVLLVSLGGTALAQTRDLFESSGAWPELPPELYPIDNSGFGFGKKVAGSFIDTGSFDIFLCFDPALIQGVECADDMDEPEVLGVTYTGLQTLGVFGTQQASNSNDFAGLDPDPAVAALDLVANVGRGVWKKTGPKQLKLRAVIQLFNASTGDWELTCQPNLTLTFSDDFTTGSGPLYTPCYAAGVDPFDPGSFPLSISKGSDSWKRMPID